MRPFRWAAFLAFVGALAGSGVTWADERVTTDTDRAAAEAARVEQSRLAGIRADPEGTVSELLGTWAPSRGAEQLQRALRAATAEQLLQVSTAESFAEVNRILLGASAGAPFGDVPMANNLGDTDQDFVYSPVEPCRIFDTRNVGGSIAAGAARDFYVWGITEIANQGGNPAGCVPPGVKGEPRAVHLNVTVVPVSGAQGNIRVYPADPLILTPPTASAVNFKLGTNIANALTVQTYYSLGPEEIRVFAGAAEAHVLADVLGYYYAVDPFDLPRLVSFAGVSSPIPASETAYSFRGPTVNVTVGAGQRLVGAAEAPLATSAGIASGRAGLCYQLGAGTITNFVGMNYSFVEIDTTRTPVAASAATGALSFGNYTVGFCFWNTSGIVIDDTNYVNGWVMVVD
jgi:hypothetical protein